MIEKIYIVGLGPGNREFILPKAVSIIESSDLVIGYKRAIDSIDFASGNKQVINTLSDIKDIVNNGQGFLSILASGDPCFYGITNYIKNNFDIELEVIPGISSFQYFMCKLYKPWNNAVLGSMHGREGSFHETVKSNKVTIWLTDKVNSPQVLCEKLLEVKSDFNVYIGENLSYEDEKITKGAPDELMNYEFSPLSVVVIERRN